MSEITVNISGNEAGCVTEGLPEGRLSYVYMFYSLGLIKIGVSKDPLARIEKMRTATPAPLSLIWIAQGTRHTEGLLHKHFAETRQRGEWFVVSDDIRNFLTKFPQLLFGASPSSRLAWVEERPDRILGP